MKSAATPAAGYDSPVGTSERGVAQSVQDRVDGTVDVAQPVTYNTDRRITLNHRNTIRIGPTLRPRK